MMMMRANLETMAVIGDSSFISNRGVVTVMSKHVNANYAGLAMCFVRKHFRATQKNNHEIS